MMRTYRFRVKDRGQVNWLDERARGVNFVWNWCNDAQKHALKHNLKWPRAFDLSNLAAGSGAMLGLHSQTVQAICERYAQSRAEKKRPFLRYRGKKALGWIPFKASAIRFDGAAVIYGKRRFRLWLHRPLPDDAKIKVGSFSRDASGRWFFNVSFETADECKVPANAEIGIDLGVKDRAVCSDGAKFEANEFYRRQEAKLATAQRAGKKKRVRAIHCRIANSRRDANHKASRSIANANGLIVVGAVSSSALARTRMAKSALDQGWSDFKGMLRYKAMGRAGIFLELNEAYTTQTCSACLARGGPRGLQGLRIREWCCEACGAVHDRDVNAARNILRLGHETLAGGSPCL